MGLQLTFQTKADWWWVVPIVLNGFVVPGTGQQLIQMEQERLHPVQRKQSLTNQEVDIHQSLTEVLRLGLVSVAAFMFLWYEVVLIETSNLCRILLQHHSLEFVSIYVERQRSRLLFELKTMMMEDDDNSDHHRHSWYHDKWECNVHSKIWRH